MKQARADHLSNLAGAPMGRFPRFALTAPFFSPSDNAQAREIAAIEEGRIVTYSVGASAGLSAHILTVGDAAVLMALLARPCVNGRTSFGSLGALGRWLHGPGFGGTDMKKVVRCLGRLRSVGIVRKVDGCSHAPVFTILSDWDMAWHSPDGQWQLWNPDDDPMGAYRASWVIFSAEFQSLLSGSVDFDVPHYLGLRTNLARALALYLPSRAWPLDRFNAERPRRLGLTDILCDLGITPPATVSERLRLFLRPQRKIDVIGELDGVRVSRGVLRCRWAADQVGGDPEIALWVEPMEHSFSLQGGGIVGSRARGHVAGGAGGRLQAEYLASGGSPLAWNRLMSTEVSSAEIEREALALTSAGIASASETKRSAKAIGVALKVLGEAGMRDAREYVRKLLLEQQVGGTRIRNPAGLWMDRVKSLIGTAGKRAASRDT